MEMMEFQPWQFFLFIAITFAIGYILGIYSGFKQAVEFSMQMAIEEYPIVNVSFYEEDNQFFFHEMVSGDFLVSTLSMEAFLEKSVELFGEKTIMLNRASEQE